MERIIWVCDDCHQELDDTDINRQLRVFHPATYNSWICKKCADKRIKEWDSKK